MNKKLIAAAVSAAVVAPVAAYGEVTVYGSIRNAIDINGLGKTPAAGVDADSVTDLTGVSSRFGIKYSQSMGNGLTAHGQYEFSAATDNEEGIGDGRVAKVGISGAFGSIDVGNQWSSYFNTVGSLVSPTYSLGAYIYSGVAGGPLRTSNTIKYANSYGPLSLQLDVRLNGSAESGDKAEKLAGDGLGLGLRFAVNDNLTIAAAFDNETGAEPRAQAPPLTTRTPTASALPPNTLSATATGHHSAGRTMQSMTKRAPWLMTTWTSMPSSFMSAATSAKAPSGWLVSPRPTMAMTQQLQKQTMQAKPPGASITNSAAA